MGRVRRIFEVRRPCNSRTTCLTTDKQTLGVAEQLGSSVINDSLCLSFSPHKAVVSTGKETKRLAAWLLMDGLQFIHCKGLRLLHANKKNRRRTTSSHSDLLYIYYLHHPQIFKSALFLVWERKDISDLVV